MSQYDNWDPQMRDDLELRLERAGVAQEHIDRFVEFRKKLQIFMLEPVFSAELSPPARRQAELEAGRLILRWLDRALKTRSSGMLLSFLQRNVTPAARLQIAHKLAGAANPFLRAWAREELIAAGERLPEGRVTMRRHRTGAAAQAAQGVPPIATIGDLRSLLGIVSRDQLGWLLLATHGADRPYRRFTIPKSDGSPRTICAPGGLLRGVQRRILSQILANIPVHPAAHGFVAGRSIVTNAAPHVGRALIVKFDLEDFFPSLAHWRIVGLFAQLGYELGRMYPAVEAEDREIAPTLARLCVYTDDFERFGGGYAPQGAPTSPAISNLVCRGLDGRLAGLAAALGGTYTRYADDLTFSFDAEPSVGRLRNTVGWIVRQEGFALNEPKFRVIRPHQRQQVTGLVVNRALRVPRSERRRFRAMLDECRKRGVETAARGRPGFADYLRGFAAYIHMVQPEEGQALMAEVEALLAPSGGR